MTSRKRMLKEREELLKWSKQFRIERLCRNPVSFTSSMVRGTVQGMGNGEFDCPLVLTVIAGQ